MADRHTSRGNPRHQPQKSPSVGAVQLWVRPQSRLRPWLRLLVVLLVSVGLSGGVALLVFSFRWGMALMLNPEALPSLQSSLLRPFSAPPLMPTTTSEALEQSLAKRGQTLGAPLKMAVDADTAVLIFPILDSTSATITELKVLQSQPGPDGSEQLTDLSSLTVTDFDRDSILAPLQGKAQLSTVQAKAFRPTRLVALSSPTEPPNQHWLTLTGRWDHQGITLHYGQLLYFNADRQTLEPLTLWSSPARALPEWADLDGEGPLDLVVNETLGLEPALQGFQVRSRRGIGPSMEIQPIAWVGVPVDAGPYAHRYHQALRLARNGLWQQGHSLLSKLRPDLGTQWNATAEAQLRLMQRHADIAKHQADQSWSMPTQQILALLIDTRWEAALARLEDSPELLDPLMRRLAADQNQGHIWNRINTATSLPEPDPALYVWGGLTLKAQESEQMAQGWLERQAAPATARQRYRAALAPPPNESLTQPAIASAEQRQTPTPTPANTDLSTPAAVSKPFDIQGMIGHAVPIEAPTVSQWYIPNASGNLPATPQWYAIQITAVQMKRQWHNTPTAQFRESSPPALWSMLSAAGAQPLKMLHWVTTRQGTANPLTLTGMQTSNNQITLLGAGPAATRSDLPPLAYTDGALVWLDVSQSSSPAVNQIIGPVMQDILYHQGPLAKDVGFALSSLLAQGQRHTLDLTGDGFAEQVLTFNSTILDQMQALGVKLNRTSHKTIILTHDNQLLYSDLFTPQTVIALTNPQDSLPVSLLVLQSGNYQLVPWSNESQQFE